VLRTLLLMQLMVPPLCGAVPAAATAPVENLDGRLTVKFTKVVVY
jgi:hypothetical protein